MLSMLDRLWHPDLTQEEAVKLMEKGIEEVSSAQAVGAHCKLVGMSWRATLHVQCVQLCVARVAARLQLSREPT